jgi:hypothetical protein
VDLVDKIFCQLTFFLTSISVNADFAEDKLPLPRVMLRDCLSKAIVPVKHDVGVVEMSAETTTLAQTNDLAYNSTTESQEQKFAGGNC